MTQPRPYSIPEFPQDDRLWLLTSIGPFEAPHDGGRYRLVEVILVAVPNDIVQQDYATVAELTRSIRDAAGSPSTRLVAAAHAPYLAIGRVFRNGTIIASAFGPPLRFQLTLDRHAKTPTDDPRLRPFEGPFNAYPSDAGTVLIPRFEVFRAFFGFTREVAAAITGAPWELAWRRLGRPVSVMAQEDSFLLKVPMENRLADRLRYLTGAHDGFVHANSVYESLLHARQPTHLDVAIPFATRQLVVAGRALPFDRRQKSWLLSTVGAFAWPPADGEVVSYPYFEDPPSDGPLRSTTGLFWRDMPRSSGRRDGRNPVYDIDRGAGPPLRLRRKNLKGAGDT